MKDIAQILFEQGKLTQAQLNEIKVLSISKDMPVESIVMQNNYVTARDIVEARGVMYNIPFVDITPLQIDRKIYNVIDENTARKHEALVFGEDEKGRLKVAMADPLDIFAVRYIEQKTGRNVTPYIAVPDDVKMKIDYLYSQQIESRVESDVKAATTEIQVIDEQIGDLSNAEQALKTSSVARIVNTVLEYAVKSKASDIHIEPTKDRLRFRYRIYGILNERLSIDLGLAPSVVSRIKILSNLKIDERRVPQDGRFEIKVAGEDVDLRVSTLPTIFGEKVVIRLLRKTAGIPKLSESGLRGRAYANYIDGLKGTSGIILITGPTGSGKTQTLASSLDMINQPTVNICTLEDPVELQIDGINQIQINPDAGLTFATGLRSLLRQDPNIIMVGEIRDKETARLATQASLTGHLVLSTVHTNSAAGALPRLLDMGVEPYLIASTVDIVVGQRLARRICPDCKEYFPATQELLVDLKRGLDGIQDFNMEQFVQRQQENLKELKIPKLELQQGVVYLAKGKGCSKCADTGYVGRTGIFEVLVVTDAMGQMIMQHRTADDIEYTAKQNGMITMLQDGYMKALEWITTVEEVLRVAKD